MGASKHQALRQPARAAEFRQTLTFTIVLLTFVSSTWLAIIDKIDVAVYWQLWSNIVSACIGWFGARPSQQTRKDDAR